MHQFQTPKQSLGNLNAEIASSVIVAAADISIIIDKKGIIQDLAFASDELDSEGYENWLGQSWLETVTIESRPKVKALLQSASSKSVPRGRQVNHPSKRGPDLPVLYSVVSLGRHDRFIAVGRDLRAQAILQQRLVDLQQSMEHDYQRFRGMEMRYRRLFQMSSEAVLILDASNRKIVEVNPAAVQLLSRGLGQQQSKSGKLTGQVFPILNSLDEKTEQSVQALLAQVRTTGQPGEMRMQLFGSEFYAQLSAALFRQENSNFFLIRLAALNNGFDDISIQPATAALLQAIAKLPDGFVVTDPQGIVLTANQAFLDLAELATEELAKGHSLENWLGRSGVDLSVLLRNLHEHNTVRLFSTSLRGEYGSTSDVEISAVSVLHADPPCLGFSIRNISQRLNQHSRASKELPRSLEQMTELIGRVPLKDLVRETTHIIERLCIEAALELTGDNRALAAEMLGLSRQSLYVKLRRFGIDDGSTAAE